MRYGLLGIVLAIFTSLIGYQRLFATTTLPSTKTLQASISAQTFVSYANALMAYQLRNPSFVGSVTGTQLAAMGNSFSPEFLGTAGNSITAFGTAGKRLSAYAQLQAGALGEVIQSTEGDASYGTSTGSTWTSVIPGAIALPLSVNAPNGSVVYVVEIGR
ncbi:type IV pilus biogenesis protein PilM [Comamonas testosteroni]|jgi:hypothetical protein|uniref:type IV pilus biogenesis protein PilM n=1 Tax=Comamonas testosteroni TaxID=285 RepID=UPI0026EEEEDB|nr:type IV pilus biogenesis protein PilM [Comamonas testosteroni]